MLRKVVIPGGNGFLGRTLALKFAQEGCEVVILTRNAGWAEGGIRTVPWDGQLMGDWAAELEGADAVINLTGRSVACRYTPENRREILESRIRSVNVIELALRQCAKGPGVLVQASSLAIYGDPGDRICDEEAPHGTGFSVEVCEEWEGAFFGRQLVGGVRRMALRIGIVLGGDGGALERFARLARWHLGGPAGDGKQYISWIHIEDFCGICRWLIDRPEASGIYNVTGPNPVTNADFMREVRKAVGCTWSLPSPAWAVRLGAPLIAGADASLALSGRRCVPARLVREGYVFGFAELGEALKGLVG